MKIEKNVLFIFENPENLNLISSSVKSDDSTLCQSSNPSEIQDLFLRIHFDIIIFDCSVDFINRNNLFQLINAKPGNYKIPCLILINKNDNITTFLDLYESSHLSFVQKPIMEIELKQKLNQILYINSMQREIYSVNSRWQYLLHSYDEFFWDIDIENGVINFSEGFRKFLNIDIKSQPFQVKDWLEYVHKEDVVKLKNILNIFNLEHPNFKLECRFKTKEAKYEKFTIEGEFLLDCLKNPIRIVGFCFSENESIKSKNISNDLYNIDLTTGLPNRHLFYDHLRMAIAHSKRYKSPVAVLLLDIDHFKRINDSLGHEFGDLILKAVAARLKVCVRETDTISRIGGDEFVFILMDVLKPQNAVVVAYSIFKALSAPFLIKGHELYINASIGISFFPLDGEDIETLVKNADTAMYRAKNQGRNTYQLYTPEMNAKTLEHLAMENSLRRAISNNELMVYYQPRINIKNGKIIGVEALVRWNHPELGILSPNLFIPIAEESGLIIQIGEQVLSEACKQHTYWMNQGFPKFNMAVNLSVRQFKQNDLAGQVMNIVRETGVDPTMLELEVTESIAMENVNNSLETLNRLKEFGINIAIDDFGTGYSSLVYLKKYPINILKIDQSFIREICKDADTITIVKAILELAKGLKLKVIVEGVENYEQMELIRALKCYEMQGYLFAVPMHKNEITPILKNGKILLTGII